MQNTKAAIRIPTAILALGLAWSPARSQIDPGCPKPQDSEFRLVPIVTRTSGGLAEPVKMDLDMDAQGNVDIYWVEKAGKVRRYDARTRAVATIGTIPSSILFFGSGNEHGVNGIALDPGFRQNRWIWIHYSARSVGFHVSRFTLNGAGMMDMASEKIVLKITAGTGWHTGGALKFDPEGNLFISVGENNSPDAGPANTNDLRGKILRIKPGPDGTYEIPSGNLFPPGTAKTRPEIYVMGVRNPYTIDYDQVRRRLTWGCVGPDNTGRPTEEHNMTATPGNFGWPYFAGQNEVIRAGKDPARPINDAASNSGLAELPPARPSVNAYNQAAAITGPVYRYTNVESKVKLPPHFDGVWFASDFNKGTIDTIGPNQALTGRTGYARIWPHLRLDRPVDFKQGPDGALYAINYSGWFNSSATTAIVRIEYTGTCRPITSGIAGPAGRGPAFAVRGWVLSVREAGHRVRVADLAGRLLYSARGGAALDHDLAPVLHGRQGLYIVSVDAASGARAGKLALPAL